MCSLNSPEEFPDTLWEGDAHMIGQITNGTTEIVRNELQVKLGH